MRASSGNGRRRLGWVTSLVGLVAVLAVAQTAQGATITPNTTADQFNAGGDCSLREAIESTNSDADARGCVGDGPYGADDHVYLNPGVYGLTQVGIETGNAANEGGGGVDVRRSC
ncbi:MAG: CSLREA domain-containing protein [Solirubrobacterales bacterium]|nr:CSLREA domain-containing protein [Solirubrobacterales bacterium]